MNEQQAKTKWCPMSRGRVMDAFGGFSGGNRPAGEYNCTGSECMMWRWSVHPASMKTTLSRNPKIDETACTIIENEVVGEGYCGLAGKP